MANDSSLLPTTAAPPGSAPTAGDNTGSAFDYSDHLDRIVTALEQLSLSMAFVADKIDNISDKIDNISVQSTTISQQQTTIAAKQTAIETYQKKLKELGEGDGVHILGPYEWLSMYAIYKLLVDQGVTDFASIKAQIDALPKNF